MRARHRYLILITGALLLTGYLSFMAGTPPPQASDYPRTESHAIAATENTSLKRAIEPEIAAHPGSSGFSIISNGHDALLERIAMIEQAERSLDLQYYSIQDDETGKLLLQAILRAADRGVRVRILIDDITVKKSDPNWALLDAHPHIEVRLFNPISTRGDRIASAISNIFSGQFTKRMHNKVFVVDNQLALIGGRNLGDAYFDDSKDFNFRDIDMLAAGPITPGISGSFDKFWNSGEAYPLHTVISEKKGVSQHTPLREALQAHWQEAIDKGTLAHIPSLVMQVKNGDLLWANARLAADEPEKIEEPKKVVESKPVSELEKMVSHGQSEFIIVSPYFIPGKEGVARLKTLMNRGVKTRILTNSLASTDVVAVHTGYRRYRKAVIAAGAGLYEMKPTPGKHPHSGRFSSSSRASLHTKLCIVDRKDILIGTMNLDPRSVQLNTEIALVIHSPPLAQKLAALFERAIAPSVSYHVIIDNGSLRWIAEEGDQQVTYDNEPKAGLWRRIKASLYALLPFEDQL